MIILINGKAGTGKTFLINELKNRFNIQTSATTWVAGSLTQSQTFYRELRLKPNDFLKPVVHTNTIKRKSKPLIIDEASMMSREQLLWLKEKFPLKDFILVGDFNQLAPVNGTPIKKEDVDLIFTLDKQYRTKDINLYGLLERLRLNSITISDTNFIERRQVTEEEAANNGSIILTYTNKKRIKHSDNKFTRFNIGQKIIASIIIPYYNDAGIETGIEYSNEWWVNNEIATIIERTPNYYKVKTTNGNNQIIQSNKLKFWKTAEVITIHKVQGQTINDRIVIDLDDIEKCTNIEDRTRLLYVAMSRATELDQLYFIGKLPHTVVLIDHFESDWIGSNEDLLNELFVESKNFAILYLFNSLNKKWVYFNCNNNIWQLKYTHPETLNSKQLSEFTGLSYRYIQKLRRLKKLSNKDILDKYCKENQLPERDDNREQVKAAFLIKEYDNILKNDYFWNDLKPEDEKNYNGAFWSRRENTIFAQLCAVQDNITLINYYKEISEKLKKDKWAKI